MNRSKILMLAIAFVLGVGSVVTQAEEFDVYVLTGQSNSLGTTGLEQGAPNYEPEASATDDDIRFFWSNVSSTNLTYPPKLYGNSGGSITSLQMQQGDGGVNPTFWGPEFGFARKLAKKFDGKKILIVKASRGGGGNSLWDKATFDANPDAGHMWGHLRDTVDAGLKQLTASGDTFSVKGLVYMQGESNNGAEAMIADNRLKSLATNLKSHINSNWPGSADKMVTVAVEIAASQANANRIQTTTRQQNLARNDSGFAFVTTSDQPLKSDGIHFGRDAKLAYGGRIVDAFNRQSSTESVGESSQKTDKLKVACVGDSITFGLGIKDRDNNSYPALLQKMLGEKYEVSNFGFSGATLLKKGHKPYWEKPPYAESLKYNPDIVIINLGANDVVDTNWKHSAEFAGDYTALIESYRNLPTKPKIFIGEITPIFPNHGRFDECIKNRKQLTPLIRDVAEESQSELIDLFSPFTDKNGLYPDGLHPNALGAKIMAQQIYTSLTGAAAPAVMLAGQEPFDDEYGTSFENVKSGVFKTIQTNVGEWKSTAGIAVVDNEHPKSGSQCLQLTGGDKTVVELQIAKGIKTDGQLSFWAERWTSVDPFSFRIEKFVSGKWSEILNGDATIPHGRAYRAQVIVPLKDDGITRLRFTCTSPPNKGILIDDLKIASLRPQRVTKMAVVPVTLSFSRVFGDHMVLQANQPIRLWGQVIPNSDVQLSLADATAKATADQAGNWQAEFPARPYTKANKSLQLSATSGQNTITINDVLVGEVWFCAGQSNMEFRLSQSDGAAEALNESNDSHLRLLNFAGAARGGSEVYGPELMQRLEPGKFSDGDWAVSNPTTAKDFSAVGFYFAQSLRAELNCPVGMINVSSGGTPIEAWIDESTLQSNFQLASMVDGNWLDNPVLDDWCKTRARLNLKRGLAGEIDLPGDELGPNHSFKPGFMYQSAVAPFAPMSLAGVLWYQGESNAETPARIQQYEEAFPLLVSNWRTAFQNADLPVAFVQLPALGRPNWPMFRETQRRSLGRLENVGMAITIDTGHPTDVHPTNKRPVGERLAQWALASQYNGRGPAMGPIFESQTVAGPKITLSFASTGKTLRTTDGKLPENFELAGSDKVYHPAHAGIKNGNKIELSCDAVPQPVFARYAWTPFPLTPVNLVNAIGLPTSPFTTQKNN